MASWSESHAIGATRNEATATVNSAGRVTLTLQTTNSDMVEGAPRIVRVEFFGCAGETLGAVQTSVDCPPKGWWFNGSTVRRSSSELVLDSSKVIHRVVFSFKMDKTENIDWFNAVKQIAPLAIALL